MGACGAYDICGTYDGKRATAIPFATAPGLLDIHRWDEPSYHLIVALSIFFVHALQSAGQDATDARNGIMNTAVALPFGLSYLIGS